MAVLGVSGFPFKGENDNSALCLRCLGGGFRCQVRDLVLATLG